MCYSSTQPNDADLNCSNLTELLTLRSEVGYWRSLHAMAVERCKKKEKLIDSLKARVNWLTQQLFGSKAEQSKGKPEKPEKSDKPPKPKKPRGKQPGASGNGRTPLDHLPVTEETHGLKEGEACCSQCKKPFVTLPGTEDSEEIEIEIKAHRRLIRRKCYKPTCKCETNPGIITAPVPPKLIPKGKFGISVWVLALLSKYYWQRPTSRLLQELDAYGLPISQGTITGGFKKLAPLIAPVASLIGERNRSEHHWHADETRWMVFVEIEGKNGYRWYLWVFQSATTVYFKLAPSRGAKVAQEHFGEDAWGIISADRYGVYKSFIKTGRFLVAFCWAHVRRDFLDLAKMWPKQEAWSLAWVNKIGYLYHLNDLRLALEVDTKEYRVADQDLRGAIKKMADDAAGELSQPNLHPAFRKVLESLQKHWSGLILFVQYPWIPMDNNTAERALRNPVAGRKGYYGSGSIWSAQLNADMLTLTHTLALWGINPKLWLTEYFEACANNGGNTPVNIERFMPWNLSNQRLKALGADPEQVPKQKPEFKCAMKRATKLEGESPPDKGASHVIANICGHDPVNGLSDAYGANLVGRNAKA